MVPLAPFCPTNPISPCSPIGPVSPKWPWWPLLPWREAINEQVCRECTNFPRTIVRVIWQFKHLILKVYLMSPSNVMFMEVTDLTVYRYSRELLYKRANWQTSKNERWILAPSKWSHQPFLLVFLFHQFCQVYPPDPGERKSNTVISGQKELSFHGNWIKFRAGCWDTHPYTHQSRRPRGSFRSFQADVTPVSFSALWTRIPLFTLRRIVQVQWKRWSYDWVTIYWSILV